MIIKKCIAVILTLSSLYALSAESENIMAKIEQRFTNLSTNELLGALESVKTYPIKEECPKDVFKAFRVCHEVYKRNLVLDDQDKDFCFRARDYFFKKTADVGSWRELFMSNADVVSARFVQYYNTRLPSEFICSMAKKFNNENRFESADVIDLATSTLICSSDAHDGCSEETKKICKKIKESWNVTSQARILINKYTYRMLQKMESTEAHNRRPSRIAKC